MDQRIQSGISDLDEQHEAIGGMVNAFQTAILARRPFDELRAMATTAMAALRAHYQYEEALMDKHAFPGAQEHRFQHERMLLTANALIEDALDPGLAPEVVSENLGLLRHSGLAHIRRDDVALGRYLVSLGMG